jgi:hypothetical protein
MRSSKVAYDQTWRRRRACCEDAEKERSRGRGREIGGGGMRKAVLRPAPAPVAAPTTRTTSQSEIPNSLIDRSRRPYTWKKRSPTSERWKARRALCGEVQLLRNPIPANTGLAALLLSHSLVRWYCSAQRIFQEKKPRSIPRPAASRRRRGVLQKTGGAKTDPCGTEPLGYGRNACVSTQLYLITGSEFFSCKELLGGGNAQVPSGHLIG